MSPALTYEIVRFHYDGAEEIRETGLSLSEAQAHCQNPETSSRTASKPRLPGVWFDGYREE